MSSHAGSDLRATIPEEALGHIWPRLSLGKLVTIRNGADYKADEADEGGYPVFGSGGEFARSSRYLFDGESVHFGRKGTIDKPLHVSGKFWTVDTMFYTVLGNRIVGRFLYFFAVTVDYSYYATNTAVPSMTQRDIATFSVPLPPIETQQQIADYLDLQTAKIDLLIEKQEQLIATLAERQDGTWAASVNELVNNFPSMSVRRVIESIVDGPFGSSLTSSHYSDEGAGVVRLGNIGIDEFKLHDRAYVPEDYAKTLRAHSVRPGDVVVAGLGDDKMPLGRAAIVPSEFGHGIVKADCYRVRPGPNISARYLAWILSYPQSRTQFRALSRGSTRQRLNTQVVRDILIPLPTLELQSRAVSSHLQARAQTDALSAKAREMIDILKERRQALISAAVTGKIDVRGLA